LIFSDEHWKWKTAIINQRISSAYDDYSAIKNQTEHQDTWLKQLIDALAEAKNVPKVCLWKQIRQTEVARTQAQQVKRVLGLMHTHSGLNQIKQSRSFIPNQPIMINNKENLEKACLEEAHKHFTQAATMTMAKNSTS